MTKDLAKDSHKEIALEVEHVSKSFHLPLEKSSGLKNAFINWTRGIKGYKEQHVLRDISFTVEKGDFFGIVGRNGSGKSTLLKIISRIYTPNRGEVRVNGSLVPFLELGVGFNPELTGRENVYLNGAMLGFSREQIDAMYDDIVDFAELHDFMDQKLKNYSSGMQVRLAFSVAIKAQGDILVLDEVLAVGDEAFQRKCDEFFQQIKKDRSKTVILVTHDMESVRKYCNKAMLILNGKVVINGSPDDTASAYTEENLTKPNKGDKAATNEYPIGLNKTVPKLDMTSNKHVLTSEDKLKFDVAYNFTKPEKDVYLAVAMLDLGRGGVPYDSSTYTIPLEVGEHKISFALPLHIFNDGDYRIKSSVWVGPKHHAKQVAFITDERSVDFSIRNNDDKPKYPLLRNDVLKIERL